ncbi:hormogonium polysaccharide biosynthesis protein HpsA [Leptothoe sp. PORK10 BA2]|uniref:hormogonium polysaccharide biosynthesis protein HpsA n=1 Tax=Leptothoe sp. PORK10 BA2 TaxID=3110254 RepID=UPI002B207985|nr:hormogonium polysaccharide biosynthesis protein HpsA [Leptothoe sp. PORK10 BA2]MEA5466008.1 hormogonium polysaccharide biosynthesis protein HpsA [Leptothoe sp. PORK10 BA2]
MKRPRVPNQNLLNHIGRLPKRSMAWVLKLAFTSARFSRTRQAGFVLPTTVMLILVLTLTVGGLSFRSFNRAAQTIAYREQQQVDNFAAPAIDRAKSKIEYLFTRDPEIIDKRPPSSSDLVNALLAKSATWGDADHADKDPYTLPDETQLDINGDNQPDPAWSFESDGNIVIYSLLTAHEARDSSGVLLKDSDTPAQDLTLASNIAADKANKLITRNGPINTQEAIAGCPISALAGDGWQDAGSNLQKNFQVNILSISNPDGLNRTVSSAEYQQVRSAPKGNKYGAWFRYDLEVFPGSAFRWNGAMHSESNFIASDNLRAYLVSSVNSCVFSADDSAITITESADNNLDGNPDGFKGHLIAGASKNDSFGASQVNFHLFNGTAAQQGANFTASIDSVKQNSAKLTDISVDPVAIFTEDSSVNLKAPGGSSWEPVNGSSGTEYLNRVENVSDAARPFLDDGYRADNRYGPKPVYDALNSLDRVNQKKEDGANISPAHQIGDAIDDNNTLASDDPATQEYGLDGYWERRSIAQGLRTIVGQRLELGNQFGWSADDPLYPPNKVANLASTTGTQKGPAEAKQQRSLRDNLSAVQGMVVYHYTHDNGKVPYICAASTVHPGTVQTLINSRTFNRYQMPDGGTTLPDGTTPSPMEINFLTGKGTNGWEFDFSSFDSDSDGDITDEFVSTTPMGKALRNLAHFAGDPRGGAPSFSPKQGIKGNAMGVALADDDDFVHPYPYLSMWGDFSVLRRIFDEYLDAGAAYDSLSPADQSTLHSAACTLGMLAYNLKSEQDVYNAVLNDTSINWSNLGVKLTQLFDMNNISNGSPIIGRPVVGNSNYKAEGLCKGTQASAPNYSDPAWTGCPSKNPNSVTNISDPEHPQNYFSRFSTDEWIAALVSTGSLSTTEARAINLLVSYSQILRDRVLGFNTTSAFQGDVAPNGNYDVATSIWTNPTGSNGVSAGELGAGDTLQLGCDPDIFNAGTASAGSKRAQLGLAVVMCSPGNSPKYPSLYYLFPAFDHGHLGADDSLTTGIEIDHTQPTTEEYINEGGGDIYIADVTTTTTKANDGYTYSAVDPATVALTPKTAASTFNQPTATVSGGTLTSRNDLQKNIINANGTITELTFLDKAMMDGRELLSVRVLDLDINKLTKITSGDSKTFFTVGSDKIAWIPELDGIFYAAREDAVREDMIVRPSQATWATCKDFTKLVNNGQKCPMKVDTTNANQRDTYDPPLADNLISPKPVDMYADPDRRPYGFRLINGAKLNRSVADTAAGLTFVTDNPAYIYGNFNLHQDSSGNILEEFKAPNFLGETFATEANETTAFNQFYGRVRANLDTKFSRGGQDLWRPAEIFADAVTILSNNFRDGVVEDAYLYKTVTTLGDAKDVESSYLNSNRPKISTSKFPDDWQREDLAKTSTLSNVNLPIRFDRNGKPSKATSESSIDSTFALFPDSFSGRHIVFSDADYFNDRQKDQIAAATPTRVNALLIAGIVPLRSGQNYGGLHNFPRLLEYWPNKSLIISGGFFQLNFSTHATAPFDQDAWEPGASPSSTKENNAFYGAARRIWGYDVGFQYTSVAPIARRFVTSGRPRSEFYRELPLDDPYIKNLCKAEDAGDNLALIDSAGNSVCQ